MLSRWRGQAPLETVFWRDMIIIGTVLNAIAGLTSILMLALDVGTVAALAVHFSLLPWNIFLFISVWRSAEFAQQFEAAIARIGAVVWFVAATVL
jgi:hypothetical protein